MYGEEKSTEHIRYQSTHSHPPKGVNRTKNRSQSCRCKRAFMQQRHALFQDPPSQASNNAFHL